MQEVRLTLRSSAALFACLIALTGPVSGQSVPESGLVISSIEAPRGAGAQPYRELALQSRVNTEAIYADKVSEIASGDVPISKSRRSSGKPLQFREGSGVGIAMVVMLLLAALLLWLRFGGTGALLKREPQDVQNKARAPENWNISSEDSAMNTSRLFDQLRAMGNRSEALVRLLRHALVAAAESSDTRFARADTEREAFGRLPKNWLYLDSLGALLREAELAHYGGREVSDRTFDAALEAGRVVLVSQKRDVPRAR